MGTDRRPADAARRVVRYGHLLVGVSALLLAGVMILAGRGPGAELEGVFGGLGLLLVVPAAVFTVMAARLVRHGREGRGVSLVLSIVEVISGAAAAAGLAVAVQGYGAFAPWRSPLLAPAALLMMLGVAGLALELPDRHTHQPPVR